MLKQDVLGAQPSLDLGERYDCDIVSLTGTWLTHQVGLLCHAATGVHGTLCFWLPEVSQLVGALLLHVPEIHNDTFAPTHISQNTPKHP